MADATNVNIFQSVQQKNTKQTYPDVRLAHQNKLTAVTSSVKVAKAPPEIDILQCNRVAVIFSSDMTSIPAA